MAKAQAIDTGSFRVLRKLIPEMQFSQDVSPGQPSTIVGGSGWETKTGPNATTVGVWRGYFDLEAYSKQDLTFIPTAVQFQEGGPVMSTDSVGMRIYDLVTKNPVTDEDLAIGSLPSVVGSLGESLWVPPGFSGSLHEMEGVIQGSMRQWTVDSTLATAITVVQGTQWGVGDATSADRLYITRVCTEPLHPEGARETFLPSTCVVVAGSPIEEPELVYLNRQRRSYELQQQPDVDL